MSAGRRGALVGPLVAGTIAWLVVDAAFVIVLVSRQIRGDILFCGDRPTGSSNYGTASWQWWYPGTRCTFEAFGTTPASVVEPSPTSALVIAGLVVWPIAMLLVGRRFRSDDSDAPDSVEVGG